MAAIDDLNALLHHLPNYSAILLDMKNVALAQALIPDVNGVWPGQPGYVNTYDVYFAAYGLVGFLQGHALVTNASSEGTSVTVQAPDWGALRNYYASMSSIIGSVAGTVIGVVPIPETPHVHRTNMADEGVYYGNVDTDLD